MRIPTPHEATSTTQKSGVMGILARIDVTVSGASSIAGARGGSSTTLIALAVHQRFVCLFLGNLAVSSLHTMLILAQ